MKEEKLYVFYPETKQLMETTQGLLNKKVVDTLGIAYYKGPVGYQGGIYQGGLDTHQIYVNKPWELGDTVKIIESKPLK